MDSIDSSIFLLLFETTHSLMNLVMFGRVNNSCSESDSFSCLFCFTLLLNGTIIDCAQVVMMVLSNSF